MELVDRKLYIDSPVYAIRNFDSLEGFNNAANERRKLHVWVFLMANENFVVVCSNHSPWCSVEIFSEVPVGQFYTSTSKFHRQVFPFWSLVTGKSLWMLLLVEPVDDAVDTDDNLAGKHYWLSCVLRRQGGWFSKLSCRLIGVVWKKVPNTDWFCCVNLRALLDSEAADVEKVVAGVKTVGNIKAVNDDEDVAADAGALVA